MSFIEKFEHKIESFNEDLLQELERNKDFSQHTMSEYFLPLFY